MEEGMREGARQQRTIEARERPTNEAGNEGGKEQHAAAFSDDDGSERRRSFGRGRFSSSAAPLSLPPSSMCNGGRKEGGKRLGKENVASSSHRAEQDATREHEITRLTLVCSIAALHLNHRYS